MDCYIAAEKFSALVDSLGIDLHATPLPHEKEHGVTFLPFAVTLTRGNVHLFEKWSAGEGIAFQWAIGLPTLELRRMVWALGAGYSSLREIRAALRYGARVTLHVEAIRERVRRAYRPSLVDVLPSLLHDSMSANDPQEFAECFSDPAKCLEAWQRVQVSAPKVRDLLGARYAEACELACMM